MNINDDFIINFCKKYKYFKFNTIKKQLHKISEDCETYIINRFEDTNDFNENLWRIVNKIYNVPICPICGKKCKFEVLKKYHKTCNDEYCVRKLIFNNSVNTNFKNHGVPYILNIPEVKEKRKLTINNDPFFYIKSVQKQQQTCLNKYGVINAAKLEITKLKMKQTNILKYGHICAAWGETSQIKSKQTCQKKYGCDYIWQADEIKDKIYNTKKKNKSFGPKSKEEDKIFNMLSSKFDNVKRQYKDKERYPYACDFYIPKLDLFIEYQGYYTHGSHPFNKTNHNDIKQIDVWNNKNYKEAIYNWTVRDPLKRETAKQNNLNYLEFFNLKEFNEWYEKI